MSTTRNLKLARFLKTLLDFLFGFTIFGIVGLVIWVAVSPTILNKTEGLGTVLVPVTIGMDHDTPLEVVFSNSTDDSIYNPSVIEAKGTLSFATDSIALVLIANVAKVIGGMGVAAIFYLLREIVKAILEGEPFSAISCRRIRQLGYAVPLVSILWQGVHYVAANEVLRQLPTADPQLHPGPSFESGLILISLLIFLLAQVWSYGLDIERERKLTI